MFMGMIENETWLRKKLIEEVSVEAHKLAQSLDLTLTEISILKTQIDDSLWELDRHKELIKQTLARYHYKMSKILKEFNDGDVK